MGNYRNKLTGKTQQLPDSFAARYPYLELVTDTAAPCKSCGSAEKCEPVIEEPTVEPTVAVEDLIGEATPEDAPEEETAGGSFGGKKRKE